METVTEKGHEQVEESKEEEQPIDEEDEISITDDKVAPAPVEVQQSFMDAARSEALRPFVIISTSYLLFTVTDGAIRMIVLLHAYNNNFSAFEVAIMFTLYELAGVFTNLAAGVMGAKWGIKVTLVMGLSLQLLAYGLLFGWQEDWSKGTSIVYVTIAQMFAGIAKDLTKLGGKTVTKLVTPEEQDTKLFKLVSLITGWKNSLKGVGYFLGSALLQVSYYLALSVMMGLVALAMPWAIIGLDKNLGTAKKKNASWTDIFNLNNRNLNILSLARLFLFASRDFWFEVPLPFFLRSPSCEGLGTDTCDVNSDCNPGAECNNEFMVCQNINTGGGCGGVGLDRVVVGAFLGGYIILYGQVQSWTPQLVTGPLDQTPPNKWTEVLWGLINCIPTLIMTLVLAFSSTFEDYDRGGMIAWMVTGIVIFAIIFAVNSSIHSYLVVKYASTDKIAVSVGFYYMSNALGRLFGTLGSGLLYTYVGEDQGEFAGNDAVAALAACFLAGTLSSLTAALITVRIEDDDAGLKCGSCCVLVKSKEENDEERGIIPTGGRPYHLVVVESDEKAELVFDFLEEYVEGKDLGHDYVVKATNGDVRDLAYESHNKTEEQPIVGVDVQNEYKPAYEILPGKKPVLKELRSLARDAQKVLLATNTDREGETLAWHLSHLLPSATPHERVILVEITPDAIREAIENPREVDRNLAHVDIAQKIYNRLVESTMTPLIEEKIAPGISTGQLETVAMEFLVRRERERLAYKTAKFWIVKASFGQDRDVEAIMVAFNDEKFATETDSNGSAIDTERQQLTSDRADELLATFGIGDGSPILRDPSISSWAVTSVQQKDKKIAPPKPFTTVTLLQQSYERLGMSIHETMETAEMLYEAGCISFVYTDSTLMSEEAHSAIQTLVTEKYGPNMVSPPRKGCDIKPKIAKDVQEAIRPAVQPDGGFLRPEQLSVFDSAPAMKLYELIYLRTLASRMPLAVISETSVEITGKSSKDDVVGLFLAKGSSILQPGYTLAWARMESDSILPTLVTGQALECSDMHTVCHTTQPPPRFTEAAFVCELHDKLGCRPRAYTRIIQNLRLQGFVGNSKASEKNEQEGDEQPKPDKVSPGIVRDTEKGQDSCDDLVPSLPAFVLCSMLERHYATYLSPEVTAGMHRRLDEVASGTGSDTGWRVSFLDSFYAGEDGFAAQVARIEEEVNPDDARMATLPECFLNNDVEEDKIGLFVGPSGSYAQKMSQPGVSKSRKPTVVIPPSMAADISTVDTIALRALIAAREEEGVLVGNHPKDGREIRFKVGMFGVYLQWGKTGEKKTTTHSLPTHFGELDRNSEMKVEQDRDSESTFCQAIGLTLDDAVGYVNLPRTVCRVNKMKVVAGIGPYGPYLLYDHIYVRLDKEDGDAQTIDPETAERIVTERIINADSEHGRRFVAELGMRNGYAILVRSGKFAVKYLCWRKKTVKLPDEYQDKPEDMPVEDAWRLLQIQSDSSKRAVQKPPEAAKSAYAFFCSEKRREVSKAMKASGKVKDEDLKNVTTVVLLRMWEKAQDDGETEFYEELAAADQARYSEEMELYKSQSLVGMNLSLSNGDGAPPSPDSDKIDATKENGNDDISEIDESALSDVDDRSLDLNSSGSGLSSGPENDKPHPDTAQWLSWINTN